MAYMATINRKFSYVRIYVIKKKLSGNQNVLSKLVESLLQKYVVKKGGEADGK